MVAAEAGHHVAVALAGDEPQGDLLQHLVADRVAERIVDRLEMIEVDAEHRHDLALLDARLHRIEVLAQEKAMRQPGQRVVMRQIVDPLLVAPLLRDVEVRGHPAAVLQRLMLDGDDSAVFHLHHEGGGGPLPDDRQAALDEGVAAAHRHVTRLETLAQHRLERITALQRRVRDLVHLRIAPVPDDQPLVAVEHAQALRHVVDGVLEAHVVEEQLVLALAQSGEVTLELADVLVHREPDAIAERGVNDADRAPVADHMSTARTAAASPPGVSDSGPRSR